jgi:hypothetical protein
MHDLLGGADASVNFVVEEDDEEDDGDLYVNVARIGQEEDDWQEPDDSWLDLDGGESDEEAGLYCISACMRKDDSGLEDELEYFHNITPAEDEEEAEEDRWWSPEPCGLQSEEEDEEANRYINSILSGDYKTGKDSASASNPLECEDKNGPPGQEGLNTKDRQVAALPSRGRGVNRESPTQGICSAERGQMLVLPSRGRAADSQPVPSREAKTKKKKEAQKEGGSLQPESLGGCEKGCMAERAADGQFRRGL